MFEVFLNALEMGRDEGWHVMATHASTDGFNLDTISKDAENLITAKVAWVAL